MTGFPDLYLMRHGQTEWNRDGRLQGLQDSPLTQMGITQATRLAVILKSLPDQSFLRISSPTGRAVHTATLAFYGHNFTQDARLQEIDIGRFSGQSITQLQTRHPAIFEGDEFDWYDHSPGGEGFAGLHARCAAFLSELRGPAILVTHGITLRMLRLIAMDLPMSRFAEMPVLQGAVHHISKGAHRIID